MRDGSPEPVLRDSGRRKRVLRFLPKLIVSGLLVLILARWVDWKELSGLLGRCDFSFVGLSWLCLLAGILVAAQRLRVLMAPSALRIGVVRLFKISMIARFYGLFLPAGLGIVLATWFKVTQNRYGRIQFLLVSLVEKSLFLGVTLAAAGITLFLAADEASAEVRKALIPIASLGLLGIALFYGTLFFGPLHRTVFRERDRGISRLIRSSRVEGGEDLGIFVGQGGVLLRAIGFSLLMQGMIVLRILLLFRAVAVELDWFPMLWIATLVFFLQSLPVSFAGIGVRESAFAFAFGLYELPAEQGVLIGLLFFAQLVFTACVGGILELSDAGGGASLASREET